MPNEPPNELPLDPPSVPPTPPIEDLNRIRDIAQESLRKAGLIGGDGKGPAAVKFSDLFQDEEKPIRVVRIEDIIDRLDKITDALENMNNALTVLAGGRLNG